MVLSVFFNCWINFGVHCVTRSSFQHFWNSTNLASHSWSLIAIVTKKILYISVKIYLFFHSSVVNLLLRFSFTANSWTCCSNHSSITFLSGFQYSLGITRSLSQNSPGPGNGTNCWLEGSWPRFRGLRFAKNPYTTGPFSSDLLAQVKVSHEAIWEGAGTKFPHPERE